MGAKPLAQDVFEHFPHGILVFDRAGHLVAANRAATSLVGPLRRKADGRPPRCCDLFGCETTGALAEDCLAKLAVQAAKPLPEVRVDLAPSSPAEAVWATAAPLSGTGQHFLVEIRAAQLQDRRRRTQPNWMGEPQLRIYALGRTRVESREGPIEGSWLEQRAGQLLKYLICRRGRVAYPDEIEAAIWPNEDAHASGTVRYYVHRLRRQLEPDPPPQGPSSFVIAAMGGYRLAPSVKVDADDFERLARAGLEAGTEGAREQLERAAALYEGDLIPDEPTAPWVFEERERLRTLAEQVLRALVEMDLDRGDRLSALDGLRRLVQLQPFDLGMHRLLLALCIECGRRSEAARRYMALAARLRREFNQELDFELGDLNSEEALRELQEPARLRAAAKDETAARAAGGQPPGWSGSTGRS